MAITVEMVLPVIRVIRVKRKMVMFQHLKRLNL